MRRSQAACRALHAAWLTLQRESAHTLPFARAHAVGELLDVREHGIHLPLSAARSGCGRSVALCRKVRDRSERHGSRWGALRHDILAVHYDRSVGLVAQGHMKHGTILREIDLLATIMRHQR